jgi:Carboxypeptidase regulatory-like domain
MKCPVFVLILLLSTVAAFAQTETARMSGRVSDLSGAVIVGAECKITNIETNVSTSTTTNPDGIYVIPDLRPAVCRLTIQKKGFRTVVQPSLQLYVQDAVNENFTLAIGPIKQLKAGQMAREHLSGMLINAQEAERSRPPLVEWI